MLRGDGPRLTERDCAVPGGAGPSVGVVIVSFNGRRFLNDCVRSVRGTGRPAAEIVVVDNGSSDGSFATLRAEFPGVTVLREPTNQGFGSGSNTGIRYCLQRGHDYILLLNNDTVVAPSLVAELVATAESCSLTVVAAQSYRWDGSEVINTHGGEFNWWLGRLRDGFGGKTPGEVAKTSHEVGIIGMCCVLIPAAAFREVGLLDGRYFVYYEDTDLAVRLRAAGYRLVVNPRAVLRHYEGGTSGVREASPLATYYLNRNRLHFMRQHCPGAVRYLTFLVAFHATRLALIVWHVSTGRRRVAGALVRSVRDGLRSRFGPAPELG